MGRARVSAGWAALGWSIVCALLVLIPSSASAGIALVQDVFVQSPASTNETTRTATFSSNVTAGNVLIATITGSTGATLSAVTGGGVAWTQAVTAQVPSGQRIWIYYGTASAGSTNTVTVEGSSGRWTLEVGEWAGIDNSSPLEATNSQTGNGVAPSTGSVTTTSPSVLLISVESDASTGPTSLQGSSNFTALANNGGTFNAQIHFPSYRIVSATGSYSNAWLTCGGCGSVNWAAAIAAFRADSSDITYQGSGAVNSTTATNPACTLPSNIQANDIGIWHAQSKDSTNNTHTYPGDWTKVTQLLQGSMVHSWAWKRFSGGESGTQTVTISGANLKQCKIHLFRGVRTSGDPHEAVTNAQNTTSTVDPAAVSVNNAGALVVALIAVGDDNSIWGTWNSTSGLNFYGGHTAFDNTTTTGTDGNLGFAYARVTATSGFPVSVDFGTKGMSASDPWITYTIAFVPGCPVVSDASYVVANARSGQATVYWSSGNSVVILRKAGTAFAASDIPRNTQSYSAGVTIGAATVIYNGTTSAGGTTCSASSCTSTDVSDGTTYYYMVLAKNASACYSSGVEINATPAASSPNWTYATTAATMAPVALDPWSDKIVAGSNDDKVHGKSAADGTLVFAPFIAGGPIQSRPAVIPAAFRTPASAVSVAYVTSQDGYLYAVNSSTGAELWKAGVSCPSPCSPLGSMLQGGAAVWLQALAPLTFTGGVTADVVIVATRNTGTSSDTNNKVYAVNGSTGAIVWTFAPGNMDIVSSTPYPDYSRNTVWVTSRSKSGTQSSLWKLDAATGALAAGTSTWSFGDIDSSPIASADGTLLYVGTNAGDLKAIRVVDRDSQLAGTSVSHTPASGAGAVRGMPWWLSWDAVAAATPDTIIFVRNLTVHSVNFNGTAFSTNWTQTLTWTPSSPVDDAAGNLYFGGSDGKVHRLSVSSGSDQAQVPSNAISGTFGEPSLNWDRGVIHVGASDGHIYTFPVGF